MFRYFFGTLGIWEWPSKQVHPTGLVKPDDADAKIKFLAAEASEREALLRTFLK